MKQPAGAWVETRRPDPMLLALWLVALSTPVGKRAKVDLKQFPPDYRSRWRA